MVSSYRIISIECLGNAVDGFEANDFHYLGDKPLKLRHTGDAPTDRQIFNGLKRVGVLKAGVRFKSIEIEWQDESFAVNDVRKPRLSSVNPPGYGWGKPVFQIELDNDAA